MSKNIKNGFTLAEVLIAIAIIGVIAAMNIPTVVSETQNRKMAAALGRNVEAIETGCQLIVQQANEQLGDSSIDGLFMVNNNIVGAATNDSNRLVSTNLFTNNTADFFNATPHTYSSAEYSVHSFNGGSASPSLNTLATNFAVSSKFGAYYGFLTYDRGENSNDPLSGFIYIDVNAAKGPNRYGRDIFYFGLTDSCHMVPAGTNRINARNPNIPLENNGCSGNNPTNGLSCTSRVVRNGYRMDY